MGTTKIFVVLLMMVLVTCSIRSEDKSIDITSEVNVNLQTVIRSGDSFVNVSGLVSSNWESMYIFPPYTPSEQVNSTLGIDWLGKSFNVSIDDTFCLLVFVSGRRVSAYAKVARSNGDFIRVKGMGPFKRPESRFILRQEKIGDQKWYFWYQLDAND